MSRALETPFQKSIKLLKDVSDAVDDPGVQKMLRKLSKLLTEPDSLNLVKARTIRWLIFAEL